jgi:hypothetical protein
MRVAIATASAGLVLAELPAGGRLLSAAAAQITRLFADLPLVLTFLVGDGRAFVLLSQRV